MLALVDFYDMKFFVYKQKITEQWSTRSFLFFFFKHRTWFNKRVRHHKGVCTLYIFILFIFYTFKFIYILSYYFMFLYSYYQDFIHAYSFLFLASLLLYIATRPISS